MSTKLKVAAAIWVWGLLLMLFAHALAYSGPDIGQAGFRPVLYVIAGGSGILLDLASSLYLLQRCINGLQDRVEARRPTPLTAGKGK